MSGAPIRPGGKASPDLRIGSPPTPRQSRTRLRLRFAKLGKVRFTSHRDTARIWERAVRRARLPVAYSEGYSPRARLSFGLALPTGHESLGEYLDVDLVAEAVDVDPEAASARLGPALPVGFTVQAAAVVEPGTPSLQEAVVACSWRVEVIGADPGEVGAAVEELLGADRLVVTRERKGRQASSDLRPALLDLAVTGPSPSDGPALRTVELVTELATQPRALRPGDLHGLLAARVQGLALGRVCRIHQWLDADGDRCEPLPAPPGWDRRDLAGTVEASPAPAPPELRAS